MWKKLIGCVLKCTVQVRKTYCVMQFKGNTTVQFQRSVLCLDLGTRTDLQQPPRLAKGSPQCAAGRLKGEAPQAILIKKRNLL